MNGEITPIGFDEMPPELSETGAEGHAFACRDQIPRTIVPALTNGGRIRSMDNHQLAKWLAKEAYAAEAYGAKTEADYLELLNQPCMCMEPNEP